ncbi:MAG: glycine oxidase ThiO [Chloroflexota bacterium]|nr:glycine oxidase ThiO [Chloroflexota bacterium]
MSRGQIADVAVVGGGIVGLACAWELRQRGLRVTLIERGRPGRESTWAAAGVIAAHHYGAGPGPLFDLGRRSLAAYPEFLKNVGADEVDWCSDGMLAVARTADEASELTARVSWLTEAGYEAELLTPWELRALEPLCTGRLETAALFPADGSLDPRLLAADLESAVRSVGVEVRTEAKATSIETDGSRVTGVGLVDEIVATPAVVLAAGAWCAGLAPGFRLPIRPCKGQMCAVRAEGPRRSVNFPEGVIVPRADGRIALGATQEDVGFDAHIDPDAIRHVQADAAAIVPGLTDAEIVETWMGFRPQSADGFPVIGPTPVEGLVVATGHFTKGIALAPVTAELVADLVCEGRHDPLLRPFGPDRFA